jgi:glucokinase
VLEEVASSIDRSLIVGVGVSLASPTDPDSGVMYNPPNLPGFDGFSPRPVLEERLSLRALIGNDATLAALAEQFYGAGRGYEDMLYLTISTGIGGGIIANGRLYTGVRGFAGEVGHMSIDRNGPRCNCGNTGCLETLASGTALARMARDRLASGEPSVILARAEGDLDRVDGRIVAEAATNGDKLAQALIGEVATNLGIGIVSLMHVFDPGIIVIGGGMSGSLHLLLPGVTEEIERHAMPHQRGRVPVVKSELGDDVSLLGAAALVFDSHERDRQEL